MDLNLDTLKREILDYLESRDLAVFRSTPGTLEDPQMVLWDSEHHPDYRMFLDTIKTGVKMILFATREFEANDIDDLLEQIEDAGMDHEQQREYQARLRKLRIYRRHLLLNSRSITIPTSTCTSFSPTGTRNSWWRKTKSPAPWQTAILTKATRLAGTSPRISPRPAGCCQRPTLAC